MLEFGAFSCPRMETTEQCLQGAQASSLSLESQPLSFSLAKHFGGQPTKPGSGVSIRRPEASAPRMCRADAVLLALGCPTVPQPLPQASGALPVCILCPLKLQVERQEQKLAMATPRAFKCTMGLAQVFLRHLSPVLSLGQRSLRGTLTCDGF